MKRSSFIKMINDQGITVSQLVARWGLTKTEINKITASPIIHPLLSDAIKGFCMGDKLNILTGQLQKGLDLMSANKNSEKDSMIDIARSIALASPPSKRILVGVVSCISDKGMIGYNAFVMEKLSNAKSYRDIETTYAGIPCRGVIVYRCHLSERAVNKTIQSKTTYRINSYPLNNLIEIHMD